MPTTQSTVVYFGDGQAEGTTPEGTQFNVVFGINVTAGSDFTDADAFAIEQAIVAAFPASWGVTSGAMPIARQDSTITGYRTNYTATPPSFT